MSSITKSSLDASVPGSMPSHLWVGQAAYSPSFRSAALNLAACTAASFAVQNGRPGGTGTAAVSCMPVLLLGCRRTFCWPPPPPLPFWSQPQRKQRPTTMINATVGAGEEPPGFCIIPMLLDIRFCVCEDCDERGARRRRWRRGPGAASIARHGAAQRCRPCRTAHAFALVPQSPLHNSIHLL
jgi:hypothetical protein